MLPGRDSTTPPAACRARSRPRAGAARPLLLRARLRQRPVAAHHRALPAVGVDRLLGHVHLGRGQPDLLLERAEVAGVAVLAALVVARDLHVAERVPEELDVVVVRAAEGQDRALDVLAAGGGAEELGRGV